MIAVADDLTGAADTAGPFAAKGYSSIVWLHGANVTEACDVRVFETSSRHTDPAEAYRRVHAILQEHKNARVFKKFDSTLKGNLGAELLAVRDATNCRQVIVASAHPLMGRTMRNGELILNGQPTGLHLPTMLREQGIEHEAPFVVCDAENVEQLRSIAENAFEQEDVALAGTGGLAQAVADLLPGKQYNDRGAPCASVDVIAGSSNHNTALQLERLQSSGLPARIVEIGHDHLDDDRFQSACCGLREAVLICGGDTARAVASHLGANGIRMRGERIPGVPWGWWMGGLLHGKPIATKAGGFGAPDALVEAVQSILAEGACSQ